jgi:pilus assembly protein Flp/PilA
MSKAFLSSRNILSDRRGVTALEYGIVAAGLAFVFVVAFAKLGVDLGILITSVGNGL